jgi:hypothetical protein
VQLAKDLPILVPLVPFWGIKCYDYLLLDLGFLSSELSRFTAFCLLEASFGSAVVRQMWTVRGLVPLSL